MKVCRTCKQGKDLSEFRRHSKMKDGLSTQCRDCARSDGKKRYRNDEKYRQAIRTYNKGRKAQLVAYVLAYLAEHPCMDCDETDPIVLQFDHTRGQKLYNVGDIMGQVKSMRLLVAEIAKCEVVCANCHLKRTAVRAGNWLKVL